MEHWYASPNDQRAIIGLSSCFLLFSIGTFHTDSYLRHPVDCAEVICFWTLQYFHYIIVSATWWQWRTPAAAAMGVCDGCATPPLLGGGAGRTGNSAAGSTPSLPARLPPTSLLCYLRPMGSGLARTDGSSVAPPHCMLNLNNKHPCNPNPVRCCISSAILLRAWAFRFNGHVIWNIYTRFSCHMSRICLIYIHQISMSYVRYMYGIYHIYDI